MSCEHLNFTAQVDVARIMAHLDEADEGRTPAPGDDAIAFRAEVKIECADCGAELGFRCQDVGDLPDRPTVTPNALTLRVPLIGPAELELLGPLAALQGDGLPPGFAVRVGDGDDA